MTSTPTSDQIFGILSSIPDPEIPVININELGILRDVRWEGDELVVEITPTYSGCPAMKAIEEDIRQALTGQGISRYRIRTVYSPAWTTDWMSSEARDKLRKYGIAPPEKKSGGPGKEKHITCPHCSSKNTELISQFGSTACKALHRCKDCGEPFDYFKCL